MAQKAVLPVETMNKVLAVLTSMPYNQVADLINEVREGVQVVEEKKEESSDD